jgi:hypothetical protein
MHQMKLYGQEFELLGEPVVMGDSLVLVDAIEKRLGQLRRVRIPIMHGENGKRRAHCRLSSGIAVEKSPSLNLLRRNTSRHGIALRNGSFG